MNAQQADSILTAVIDAFYARHPEVRQAIDADVVSWGSLSVQTERLIEAAFEKDAAVTNGDGT